MFVRLKYFLFIGVCVTLSCSRDRGKVNVGNYPNNIDDIISRRCATPGCHNAQSAGAANDLNLETWSSMFLGSGSGSPVIPYSSRFSSLCYFVNTFAELGTVNFPTMPLNKTALAYDEVKTIKSWIESGAPDKNGNINGSDPALRKLYAVNQGCDVVTVFDSKTQLPIRFVEVGPGKTTPHQVRVSPDGKYWYVLFLNNNVMKKYRCSNDAFVGEIPLTPLAAGTGTENAVDWNTFVISNDSKRAYCVSWTKVGVISTLDLENMKLIRMRPGGNFPHGICLSKDESKVYVAAQTGNYITRIDTSFDADSYKQISLDGGVINTASSLDPHDMQISPDGNKLWLSCQGSNQLLVFDLGLELPIKFFTTGVYPQELVYSKKYNSYYLSFSGDGTNNDAGGVMSIDAVNLTSKILRCGEQPHGLAVDENTDLLYLLSRNISSAGPIPHHTSQCVGKNGFVNFINLKNFSLTSKKYELSVDPYFIYVRP